jgi:hypothetical protein
VRRPPTRSTSDESTPVSPDLDAEPFGFGQELSLCRLTERGREEFAAEKNRWLSVHEALQRFWAAAESPD